MAFDIRHTIRELCKIQDMKLSAYREQRRCVVA